MSNLHVPYQMYPEGKLLAPLRGKPLMVHVAVKIDYWPFDRAMPRSALPAPLG